MKLLSLFFCPALGGNFQQRRRFQGFHGKDFFEIDPSTYDESEMTGQQDQIDPKLQFLIDSMITNRRKISVNDFTAWNLYRKNLDP